MTKIDRQNVPNLRFSEFEGEWKETLLAKIVVSHNSGVYKKREEYGSGRNIIGVSNFYSVDSVDGQEFSKVPLTEEEISKYCLREGDILYTESSLVRAGIAKALFVTKRGAGTAFAWHTRRFQVDRERGFSAFLYYYLSSNTARKFIISVATQTALTGITTKDYFKTPIYLPALSEQRKIAGFLGAVDTKIAQLAKKKRLLEDYKKGCMQEIFSQKLRFRDNNGNNYPNWEEKRLGELCKIGSSKRVLQKDWQDNGVPFLRTREIISLANRGEFKTPIFISEELFEELKEKYGAPRKDDILATGVGSIGEVYIVKPHDRFYFKDGNVLWIRKSKELNSQFLAQQFKHKYIQKQIMDNASITTVATFTIDDARKLKIKYPHLDEQSKIADFLSAVDRKIDLLSQKLDHARTFKRGLLQQLFV